MTTRHLVDPALESFIEAPPLEITLETLPMVREALLGAPAGHPAPRSP